MNIYDVSQAAGVSIATVSRVINGSGRVSEATRAKVLKVMAESGYTPNAFARGLGLNSMHTVGLLCADLSDAYIARAVSLLEHRLRENGYVSLLVCAGQEHSAQQSASELLLNKRVDGLILVGSGFVSAEASRNDFIRELALRIPVMLLGAALDAEGVCSVLTDDRAATRNAAESLLAEGRRRILYLYHAASYSGLKKLAGYRDALAAADMPADEALIHLVPDDGGDPLTDVPALLTALDAKGIPYDAVLTSDDKLAVGALQFALAKGLDVPSDLSVIGYNDSFPARCTTPSLTSVDNRLESLCQTCVSALMDVLNGISAPKRTIFSAELIRRGTTLKPVPHNILVR